MYGEHIEEMYRLFKENNSPAAMKKIKARDIAEEVADILYAQDQITKEQAFDEKFLNDLTNEVKYICNMK